MSVSKNLIYIVSSGLDEHKITVITDWETARKLFIKDRYSWSIEICDLNEATKTYEKICEIWKKYARFGDLDCVMFQRMVGKRKYREHQFCETLNEIPTDIRPSLYKLSKW